MKKELEDEGYITHCDDRNGGRCWKVSWGKENIIYPNENKETVKKTSIWKRFWISIFTVNDNPFHRPTKGD